MLHLIWQHIEGKQIVHEIINCSYNVPENLCINIYFFLHPIRYPLYCASINTKFQLRISMFVKINYHYLLRQPDNCGGGGGGGGE